MANLAYDQFDEARPNNYGLILSELFEKSIMSDLKRTRRGMDVTHGKLGTEFVKPRYGEPLMVFSIQLRIQKEVIQRLFEPENYKWHENAWDFDKVWDMSKKNAEKLAAIDEEVLNEFLDSEGMLQM